MVADEDYLTAVTLTEKVHELYFTRQSYIESMQNSNQRDAIDKIVGLIEGIVNSYLYSILPRINI